MPWHGSVEAASHHTDEAGRAETHGGSRSTGTHPSEGAAATSTGGVSASDAAWRALSASGPRRPDARYMAPELLKDVASKGFVITTQMVLAFVWQHNIKCVQNELVVEALGMRTGGFRRYITPSIAFTCV